MTAPTKPGLYAGVPEEIYHGDRGSISSTQARRFLDVTPHRWRWERDNPKPPSDAFDLGTAVHTLVLGVGAPLWDTGYDKWQSNDAKAEVAKARAAGAIPLRPKDFDAAHTAAANVKAHPDVQALHADGVPELSAWAPDPMTGVMLRSRPDWVRWTSPTTMIADDLKTSSESGPDEFRWSCAKYGYHRQEAWIRWVLLLLGVEVTDFYFVVICTDPPYEVYVVDLPLRAVELGDRDNRRAIDGYAECLFTDTWPSHRVGTHHIDLPEKFYRMEEYAR
ncbi:PD-(D/E)XK nuclease-like domain-containing protein [Nocardia sp. NPDC050630]|uniref:PD-(D/E)XK nuclease-like domain-containing protein n=1 Tax=Nocardia sp. NPDC050630 TaxID=3364321 RepID=UPI0037BBA441